MSEKRVNLTAKQSQVLAPLWKQLQAAQARWNEAMVLLDLDPAKLAGGALEDDPHLIVRD